MYPLFIMDNMISFILNTGAELVGKKWRAVIIWHLKDGPLRFSDIKRLTPEISVKMLSEVLKEMNDNEIILRKQYNTIPVKVTYEIHPDAIGFVEANVVCTIKIGEYIAQNHKKLGVSQEDLLSLQSWLFSIASSVCIFFSDLIPI